MSNLMQEILSGGPNARNNEDSHSSAEIETRIRSFMAQNLLCSESGFTYPDDASFLSAGIIDSLGVVELVGFLERDFALQVKSAEVTPRNFDSVSRLAAFIRRKSSGAVC